MYYNCCTKMAITNFANKLINRLPIRIIFIQETHNNVEPVRF